MPESERYWEQYDPQIPVVLFGAKDAGVYGLHILKRMRKNPVCFCDNNPLKQGTVLENLPVRSLEEALRLYPESIIIICTHNRYNEQRIQEQLSQIGNIHVESYIELLIHYHEFRFSYNFWHVWKTNQYCYLPYVAIDVTRRCTLNCQDCSSLIPFYRNPEDFDAEQIIADVKELLKYPVVIEQILLNGGEPLLHPELEKICWELNALPQILRIQVVTNGTILPDDALMQCFHQCDVEIIVSDYGKLSKRLEEIIAAGKKHDVPVFLLDPADMWVDFGKPVLCKRTEKEHQKLFRRCYSWIQGYWLMDKRLFLCALSAVRVHLGVVEPCAGDCFDLYQEGNPAQKNKKLRTFLDGTIMPNACRYCNSRFAPSITPAIQAHAKEYFR